jgi:hypothetical protein
LVEAMRIAMRVDASAGRLPFHREFHVAAGVDVFVGPGELVDADWIIESGTDEFWWPWGSLKEILSSVPSDFGAVQALSRELVPEPGDLPLEERIAYRLVPEAPRRDRGRWRPERRFIRRGHEPNERALRGWYPVEVLQLAESGVSSFAVALAEGLLQRDTRLLEALRRLSAGEELTFPLLDAVSDAQLAADAAVLGDADVLLAQERLDEVEGRLALLESSVAGRIERTLRKALRRGSSA